ncbi:hypothetical protein [Paenibacillus polymyxa]|uniref:Uncharacterized protein n=1 Tax=Paenibacillus polymyxa TaxID=1406 RepID=A0AAP3ZZD3_PAEPO|nr:hypothetical protein [Paenibacillus polymyxa]MDH2332502.1 hypothetical protein [Paenibacillus polymyxa]
MTKYTSRYVELGFYVNGELKRFVNGEYRADSEADLAVLDALTDAVREETEQATEEPKKPRAKKAQTAETTETSEE